MDIWIKELPDGPAKRLTFSDEREMNPSWPPVTGESRTILVQNFFEVLKERVGN